MDKEKLLAALRELQTLGERGVRGEDMADKIRALILTRFVLSSDRLGGRPIRSGMRGAAYGDR